MNVVWWETKDSCCLKKSQLEIPNLGPRLVEFKGRFFVVMFAESTRKLNVNLWFYIYEFWKLCGCFLNLGYSSNVVLCYTWHINEHEKWNIVVQGNVHYQKAIKNMTQWSNVIHNWPPVKKLVDHELCLPSSEIVPIL